MVAMTLLSRLRAWIAVTVWYYRQAWRRPADSEPTTLTRLPQPRNAEETPAAPPQTLPDGAGGMEGGHDVAAVRGSLLRRVGGC